MRTMAIGIGWLAATALAGTAMAQQGQQSVSNHPRNQKSGLFPPNEPVPAYSSSANGSNASMQAPGGAEPNAGNTGMTGSGSTSHGWNAPAYSSPAQKPR